ncbi:multicopper oxidase domain-containing protein [Streptomyces sp. NPDC047976]|uniref:multicopper oxidase domain-containing protein n=1 Tax=unclassified Streptomyces TaxID=2593676 RepID=UPI00341EF5C5
MRRRAFLLLAAATGVQGCGSASGRSGRTDGPTTGPPTEGGTRAPANPLRIPPLLEPVVDGAGVKTFTLTAQRGKTEFLPGKPAPTWGFNGSYLGPTLRASRGDRVRVNIVNRIGEDTTVHWHGMRVPALMDGGPQRIIAPDATWSPHWTVDQPAATTWKSAPSGCG